MTSKFDVAHNAIQGARDYQEDFCDVTIAGDPVSRADDIIEIGDSGELLAVLADGMGGHVGGAEASALACRSFMAAYKGTNGLPQERMAAALAACNHAIAERIQSHAALDGMGCTFLGVLFDSSGMRWISVGDSILYIYRNNLLWQLNEDHSMAPVLDKLVDQGKMDREEAVKHPQRHHLRSALTGSQIDLIQLRDQAMLLQEQDWILIASDGIQTLEPNEIEKIVEEYGQSGSRQVVAAILEAVDAAREPYQDNTSVIAISPVI